MTDNEVGRRVELWKVAKVSNASLLGGLFDAISGSIPGAVRSRVFEVEAWPDGLLITGTTDSDRWVGWEEVTEIEPPSSPGVTGQTTWVKITLNDGSPVRLGPEHLLGEGNEALADAEDKVDRLRSAWTAWRTGVWPPT